MFNKNKKRNDHRRIFFDRGFESFFRFINKYSTRQFAVAAVIIAVAVISTFEGFEYIYKESVITRQTAIIQNEAVLIAAEYSNYESLDAAENNNMNSRLSSYSALNQIRIRVVNLNYVISVDTYAIDTNKTILNSRVFDIFSNHKNSSGYDKKTGNIQAAVPVYNDSGTFIAVLIADLDYTEIDAMFHDVNGQNNNIKVVIITICLVVLIIGIYLLNRPVKRVLDIVSNVSAGHTDERIPVKGYTEIREIADDFNNIMDRANETDQSRAEFVSNVSHELKTPLTSIRGYSELLRQHAITDPDQIDHCLDCVLKESDHMTKLINDILTISKLEAKDYVVQKSHIKLKDLLENVLNSLSVQAKAMNLDIDASCENVTVYANLDHIQGILYNLISNAIKYNKPNGKIIIIIKERLDNILIKVMDTGIGISKEDQEKVFQRFYRVDKQRSKIVAGTGIGLAIVKHIVQFYNGSISLKSKENEGTSIEISLPIMVNEEPNNLD